MERQTTFGNTTLIAEGTLVKGEPGTQTNPPISDVFEAEEYRLSNAFSKDAVHYYKDIDITELLSDLNDLLAEHPISCECGKKHIYNLLELLDELLNN